MQQRVSSERGPEGILTLLSIKEESSPVSKPDHAPPSPGSGLDELWLKFFSHPESHFIPKPDPALSDAHVSSSSAPLGPDHGSINVVQEPAPEDLEWMSELDGCRWDRMHPNRTQRKGRGQTWTRPGLPLERLDDESTTAETRVKALLAQ